MSKQLEIKLDVHCRFGDELYRPAYRIFVDGDLLAERNFIWAGDQSYIEELLTVQLNEGKHYIKFDKISDPRGLLYFDNIRIDGSPGALEFSI